LETPQKSNRTKETAVAEVEKANIARAAVYLFLSQAFKVEVDEILLNSMSAIMPMFKSIGDSQTNEQLEQGSRELFKFAEHIEGLDEKQKEKLLEDLAVEYASLFLGTTPKYVFLLESVYLGTDHLKYGAPYHKVLEAYKRLGFTKAKGFQEAEDHVAVEFEFMSNICTWTAKTIQKRDTLNALAYLNLQNEFLRDHILRWVPDLCNKLDKEATLEFYRMLAHLTLGFVTLENEIPDHMTEVLKDAFSV
jgi:putative dimethyl sulfoxide reductase chaperone